MLPFFRPKNDKDIGDKLVGKQKKYRLARNGSAVAVTGTLLAYYRRDVLPDGLMPPAGGRVELFAVIRTQAGRFFCYYIVTYPETEDIAGRQEYAHVCADFEAVQAFLGAMAYPGKGKFVDGLLAAAQQTLAILAGGGKVNKAALAAAKAAAKAASEAGSAAGEPAAEPAADAVPDETPSPQVAEAALPAAPAAVQTPAPAAGVKAADATEAGEDEDVSAALARLVARARADIAREAEAQKQSVAQADAGLAKRGRGDDALAEGGKQSVAQADADLPEGAKAVDAPIAAEKRPAARADADLSEKVRAIDPPAKPQQQPAAVQVTSGPVVSSAAAAMNPEPASPDAPQAPAGVHAGGRLVSVADILADAPFQGGKKPKKASKRA